MGPHAGHLAARGSQSRNQTKQQCRQQAKGKRETNDSPIQLNFARARQNGSAAAENTDARQRNGQAQQAAWNRQAEGFEQKLSNNLTAARTQRESNGDFALAAVRLGQQQAGDIGARNQQNEGDRAKQNPERTPYTTDRFFFERFNQRRPVCVRGGKLRRQPRLHPRQIGPRRARRHALFQAANGAVPAGVTKSQNNRPQLEPESISRHWRPEIAPNPA